jgi:hypothetical protein
MLKNKFINTISLFIYLFSIAQVAKRTILSDTLEYHSWSFSELLVSYPGQFTRRGFIGEIISIIDQDSIFFDTVNKVVFINFVIFTLLSFTHIKLSKLSPIQHFLYLISIFGIFNITLFNQYYPRKEMFVLNLFMLILLIIRLKINKFMAYVITVVGSVLMILIHEGIAMIAIAFLVIIYKKELNVTKKILRMYASLVFLTFSFVIFTAGSDEVANSIWTGLSEFDRSLIPADLNAIIAIGWSLWDSFMTTQIVIFSGSMFLWSFYVALLIGTLIIIFQINLKNFDLSLAAIKSFLINEKYFLVIPILFVVGFDWGRWIFSIFHLCFFTYLIFQKDKVNKLLNWSLPISVLTLVSLLTVMPECCLEMGGTQISSNYYRVLISIQETVQSILN